MEIYPSYHGSAWLGGERVLVVGGMGEVQVVPGGGDGLAQVGVAEASSSTPSVGRRQKGKGSKVS
jgi:hypothetical protein